MKFDRIINLWYDTSNYLIKSYSVTAFDELMSLQFEAKRTKKKIKVMIGDQMDIFEDDHAIFNMHLDTGHLRRLLFTNIYQGRYPDLDFIFTTKHDENIRDMMPHEWFKDTQTKVEVVIIKGSKING